MIWRYCKPFFPEISSVSVQYTALNPYSIQPRYPRELIITEQNMLAAIENAKAVYMFAEPFIEDAFKSK
jgi:hypothetical protein